MPRLPKISDGELLRMIARGETRSEIARRYKVSRQAVSERAKTLLDRERFQAHVNPRTAMINVFNARAAAEDNFRCVMEMLYDKSLSTAEKLRVAREVRQQIAFSFQSIDRLVAIESAHRFIEETLAVLDEEGPEFRDRILDRIEKQDRREDGEQHATAAEPCAPGASSCPQDIWP